MAKSKEELGKETKNAEAKAKKTDKNKKPNIFVRMGRKIKETFMELKRVTWPTPLQAIKATGVVLVIVLIFLVVATGVNYGFSALLQLLNGLAA